MDLPCFEAENVARKVEVTDLAAAIGEDSRGAYAARDNLVEKSARSFSP